MHEPPNMFANILNITWCNQGIISHILLSPLQSNTHYNCGLRADSEVEAQLIRASAFQVASVGKVIGSNAAAVH